MSYLLDALNRAEASRQQHHATNVPAVHEANTAAQPHRTWWWPAPLLMLLVGVSIWLWFTAPQASAPQASAPQASAPQASAPQAPAPQAPAPQAPAPQAPAPQAPAPQAPAPQAPAITPLEDVSDALRQALPDMHVDAHWFSEEPHKSMVIINGHTLHQGASFAAGQVVIEQITAHGMVIRFRQQRIELKTFH